MRPCGLFDILNLFPELLDRGLQIQAVRGQGGQRRLAAKGVGLAHELLGQEVQAPAGGRVGGQQGAAGGRRGLTSRSSSSRTSAFTAMAAASWTMRSSDAGLADQLGQLAGVAVLERGRLAGGLLGGLGR